MIRRLLKRLWTSCETKRTYSPSRAIVAARLEDRIMYSAAPGGELLIDDVDADLDLGDPSNDSIAALEEFANSQSNAASATNSQQDDPTELLIQQLMAVAELGTEQNTELVIVDTSVEDYEQLVADLIDDPATRYEVIYIHEDANGIDQISSALKNYNNLSAIHVLSHGNDGAIHLGNSQLNADTLNGYTGQIAMWGDALNNDGDILFYGCDLAATEQGQELLDALAALCDCDIAASDDLTGHKSLGGDWDLEYQIGQIQIDPLSFSHWIDVLAGSAPVATDTGDYNSVVETLSPVSVWRLGEGSGMSATDSQGISDGTYNGSTLGVGGALAGDADTAVSFDGNDYLSITHNAAYLLDDGAISLWFNADSIGSTQGLFSKDSSGFDDGGHVSISLLATGQLQARLQSTTTNYTVTSATSVGAGTWNHVAFDFGAAGMALYVNGALEDTNAYTGGLGTTSGGSGNMEPIVVGASSQTSNNLSVTPLDQFFTGRIDEVAVLSTQLNAEIVQALHSSSLQFYETSEDGILNVNVASGVLANDYDPEGDTLSAILVSGPTYASAFTLNADGSFTYTPNSDWSGEDTFTYQAYDGTSMSSVATATITTLAVNDSPIITGGPDSAGLTETNAGLTTNGTLTVTDVDTTDVVSAAVDSIVVTGSGAPSLPAGLTNTVLRNFLTVSPTTILNNTQSTAVLTWDFDSGSEAFDFLATGETLVFTYTVSATDDAATPLSDNETVTITITGSNDAPTLDSSASPQLDRVVSNSPAPSGAVGTMISDLIDYTLPSGQLDNSTDADNSSVLGIAITAANTTNGNWHYSTDGGTNWTNLGSVNNASARLLAADANTRVYFQATGSFDGTIADALTFHAWDQTSGTNGALADASLTGLTTAFSVATDTASIIVNDAPVLDAAGDMVLTAITEDQTANVGDTVAAIIASAGGDRLTDINSGDPEGIAITSLSSGNGSWQYSIDGGTVWNSIGSVSTSSALVLRDSDLVRLIPDAQNGTSASITFLGWDQTSGTAGTKLDATTTGGATDFSTTSETASITVSDVNDAPVLDASGSMNLTTINEDEVSNSGDSIASIISSAGGNRISDVDSGANEGVAITSLSSSNGTWEYSVNGGVSWSSIGAVSNNSSLLLRATDLVRFVPNAEDGTTASFSFRAWDQTNGSAGTKVDSSVNGGVTEFGTATESAFITVDPVNDSPIITGGPDSAGLTETDAGLTTNGTLTVTDVDTTDVVSAAVDSIVVTGSGAPSLPAGLTNTVLRNFLTVSPTTILNNTQSIAVLTWDFDSGSEAFDFLATGETLVFTYTVSATDDAATPLSDNETVTITITGINDAPTLDSSASPQLDRVVSNSPAPSGAVGTMISDLIDYTLPSGQLDNSTDADNSSVLGIAITAANTTNGNWHYSTDGGTNWTNLGSVNNASARLLAADANTRVYFQATGSFDGTIADALTFHAWDQTSGTNGALADASLTGLTTAFSVATDTASIIVNDAPVLDAAGDMVLTAITEDQTANVGDTVAAIIASAGGDRLTDINSGDPEGIAITSLSSGNGSWQYSIDGGTVWNSIGSVSTSSALVLRDSDLVRLIPDAQNGTSASITFLGWDQTSGTAGTKLDATTTGGATDFSTTSETASITVSDVNDAPVLNSSASPQMNSMLEDQPAPSGAVGTLISSLVDFSSPSGELDNVSDVDIGAQLGIAITAVNSSNGVWYYSIDNGTSWSGLGTVSSASAPLLAADSNTRIYFHANTDYNGTIADALTFHAWDQTSGTNGAVADASLTGLTTAYSIATDTASLYINDAPVLDNSGDLYFTSITEDETNNSGNTVASILSSDGGNPITDLNFGAIEGIAVTSLSSGNGTWQYSIDGGTVWSSVGTVSDTSGLLLRSTDSLRFVPDQQNGTSASVSFRAWDQTIGTAGSKTDVSSNGNTTPFSTGIETAAIIVTSVNDAPVLDATGTMNLTTINEDEVSNSGDSIASIVASAGGDRISDVDIGAIEGIAITSLASGNGSWEYSVNGGVSWFGIGAVSDNSSLLLRETDLVRFVPDSENGTTASFSFRAWDQSNGTQGTKVDSSANGGVTEFGSTTETASITVNPINDDPTNGGTLATDVTILEDVTTDLDLSSVDILDVDAATGSMTVTLSVGSGVLDAATGTGITIAGSGSNSVTLDGTIGDLNAYLNTTTKIQYTGALNLNGDDADVLTFMVNDNGNTGSGGGTPINFGSMNIDLTAVNDAPINTLPGTQSVAEETATAISGISISDVDVGGSNLTTQLQVSAGVLNVTLAGSASISSGMNGTGDLTIQGSAADINATLASLTYTGNTNLVGVNVDTLTVTTNDLGNTGLGGALQDVDTVQIDITAVNDTPVVVGPGSTYTVNEQTNLAIEGTGFSVSDVDAASGTMMATISVVEGAITIAAGDSGVTISGGNGTGTVTVTGSLTEIDNLLTGGGTGTITYNNGSDTPSATTTITVTVNDGGNTGTDPGLTGDGSSEEDFASQTINITAVNDAPINTVPGTQSVAEETATSISGISIADVDSAGSNLTTQLQVSAGVLNVTLSGGATISGGTNGTSDLTIQGSAADINATLVSLTYTGNTDLVGVNVDTLTVTTNDLGNIGIGGALQDVDTVQIDITAVNDTPVVSGPGSSYTVNEQTNLSIEGTGFSVADVDAASGTMTATLTVGEGAFTVAEGDSGVTISGGNGTGTVTLTGTLTEIDSLLTGSGTGTITYNNGSDTPSAITTITVTVNDGGNTGADPGLTGNGTSEEDFASQTIYITALNDDPTNGGSLPTDVTILEDVTTDLDLSSVDILDVDAASGSMTVTLSVGSGVLDAAAGTGITIAGSGSNSVTLDGTLGDLNNYLNTTTNIQYTGALNLNGDDADILTFTVNDNGNTGSGGGTPINFGSMNIDLTAVNDDPVNIGGLLPSTVTLTEDVAADLDLSAMVIDDVDVLAGNLTITMATTSGATLSTSGGTGITVGGSGTTSMTVSGTIADVNAFIADSTSVQLQGAADAYGVNADQVTVTLSDNGNTGLGGGGPIAMGVINVDINPVNDAAVVSNLESAPLNYTENDGAVSLTSLLSLSDVDDTHLESATVQITGNYINGEDLLAFVDTVNISGSFDALSGMLTLTGTDTISNYEAALRSITYENISDDPSVAMRTVEWIVNDGDDDSLSVTRDIAITAVNDASVIGGIEVAPLNYTENDGPTNISSTIMVGDVDDTHIESAQVVISGNYVTGEDVLDFANTANITASFDSLTGILTLTGSDTLANYQTALQNVTYENLSENPDTSARTVSFTVNDGDVDSNIATRNISVTPVNDAPIANPDGPIVGNEASSFILTPTSNDIDYENDTLTITAINGNAIVAGGASIDVTGGAINLAADGFTLTFTPTTNAFGDADFTYTITDGNGLYDTATVDLDIVDTRAPDMPLVTISEDVNNDGFINIAERLGDLDVLVTLPIGALEGESLSINGVNQVLDATDISNGYVIATLPAPAHNDTVTVSVYLFDPAGNTSSTNLDVAYVDLVRPVVSGALDLISASDDGLSNSDDYTGDLMPTFRLPAGTGDPGDLVRVFADGVELGTDYVNPDGSAEITVTITNFQIFRFTYTFTDVAGNESSPSIGLYVGFYDKTLPYSPPADPDILGVENTGEPTDPLAGLPGPTVNDAEDDKKGDEEKPPAIPGSLNTSLFEFEETQTARNNTFLNRSTDSNLRTLLHAKRELEEIKISSFAGNPGFRVAETNLNDDQSYAYQLDAMVKRIGILGDELRDDLSDVSLLAGTATVGASVVIAGYSFWVIRAVWIASWVATTIPTCAGFDPLTLLENNAVTNESLAQIAKGKKSSP